VGTADMPMKSVPSAVARRCQPTLRQQSTFDVRRMQSRGGWLIQGLKVRLSIMVLAYPKNVGQLKIIECSGLKPISTLTVIASVTAVRYATLGLRAAGVTVSQHVIEGT
jgi:hypothetical protein